MEEYKTLVVNIYGGPGVGKTTLAHELVAELSKHGVLTEYVAEYAKELVWSKERALLDGTVANQRIVTGEQRVRIERLLGQVQVIVTDSPILLGMFYANCTDPDYGDFCMDLIKTDASWDTYKICVQRNLTYDQRGRKHTEDESMELDRKIAEVTLFDIEYQHGTDRGYPTNNFGEILAALLEQVDPKAKVSPKTAPYEVRDGEIVVYPHDGSRVSTSPDPADAGARWFEPWADAELGPWVEIGGEDVFWHCNECNQPMLMQPWHFGQHLLKK